MKFDYKKKDNKGEEFLRTISSANNLNRWIYETILTYCDGEILEIGSGIGNISKYFINENKNIYLSDIRSNYRDSLKSQFSLSKDKIVDIDISHPNFNVQYKEWIGQFDSVFSLNVVEHIENDSLAIENMAKLLKKGGKLITLVPAYQSLYNNFDKNLMHYRRYNKHTLSSVMKQVFLTGSQGKHVKTFYFNFVGTIGWYVSGKLFKNNTFHEGEVKLYNFFIPVIKLVDKLLLNKVGLSVITVWEK